ncbi:hypothetical protein J2R76_003497 [Bradyrhizobium sp. USDA 4532]|uniref:hypothetical protein n=1 Tax=unclassified Bradyrhizobium TaxID=2631580 RepID=UPI00209F5309|nr:MULTISPECIES: hypothetical protein [unclassified Bradyrhizobium]MCP1835161.1 hypothetical protein [Bradyrhizobium sp. USDA 4545]MCP1919906.1 hypothetical protein [Bradyrhizobium sp. USDA 4532]
MDSIERALSTHAMPTIIEDEEIQHPRTEASPSADPTDFRQQPVALRRVGSSNAGDNSLGSMSQEFRAVLAAIGERRPESRLNRPYRESALRDGPRFARNPSQGRPTDGLAGIVDRNGILDSSGGIASEADINEYRQWCLARLDANRQGASAERLPLALPNDSRFVRHDSAREPTTPGQQAASSFSVEPVRPQGAQEMRRRHDTVDTFDNFIESRDDTSDSAGFTASEENLRRQRALLELTRPESPRDRVRSDDSTVREVAHVFAMQRGQQAGPSAVGPFRGLGFQNQEADGPSSSAEPSRHHQRLDRATTGPINDSGHLDFGPVVGPNWAHRDQPAPASLILQLHQHSLLPSSNQRQTTIEINSVAYTVVRGPGGSRDIRLFRNRYVPPPQSGIVTP